MRLLSEGQLRVSDTCNEMKVSDGFTETSYSGRL